MKKLDFGTLGRFRSRVGDALDKIADQGRICPGRFIEIPVDLDWRTGGADRGRAAGRSCDVA